MRTLPAAPLLLARLVAGCDLIERPPLADDFGAPYTLLVGAPSGGDGSRATPYISTNGELVVTVRYSGGCNEHFFGLRSTVKEGTAQLWLTHEDFGDACEALREEMLTFQLSATVLAQPTIELLLPGGQTVPLRTREDG
ncbi:MAG: hypothetical protein R3181_02225 [Rubricoccaceae bacterium]|nr:hypothetical protein [Rubricoccaceae bacterium]